MRALLLALLVACQAACQTKPAKQAPPPPPADASIDVDWAGCEAALQKAPSLGATRRAQFLLDACQPCGDWAPLLHWSTLPGEGGPARLAIEAKMLACGYCSSDAKQKFLGTLDGARGTDSFAPWKVLGEACADKVSAVPDARFMSAPYYALDRIARAAGARPSSVKLLAAIDLPLPAVSMTGSGYELPTAAVTTPAAGPAQITVTISELRVGTLPHARLTPQGLVVANDYPGELVEPYQLVSVLASVTGPIAVIAPRGLPATRIAQIVGLVNGHELRLAVVGPGSPEGWIVPGTIPILLQPYVALANPRNLPLGASADPAIAQLKAHPAGERVVAIELADDATAASLAKLLGAIAFQGGHAAMLTSVP